MRCRQSGEIFMPSASSHGTTAGHGLWPAATFRGHFRSRPQGEVNGCPFECPSLPAGTLNIIQRRDPQASAWSTALGLPAARSCGTSSATTSPISARFSGQRLAAPAHMAVQSDSETPTTCDLVAVLALADLEKARRQHCSAISACARSTFQGVCLLGIGRPIQLRRAEDVWEIAPHQSAAKHAAIEEFY